MILDEKVRSIMQTEVHSVDVHSTMSEVYHLLETHPFHHLPVVEGQRLVGILSSMDLARLSFDRWVDDRATRDAWLDEWPIRNVMTALPDVLRPDDPIRTAAERLGDGAYHALPVVDHEHHLVGIVTTTDLVRLLFTALR